MANQIGTLPFASNRNPFNYEKIEQVNRDIQTNWLTLEEITQQLNLYGDESQDGFLDSLEVAVRMHIEDFLGKPIFPITYRIYYGNPWQYSTPANLDLPETSMGQTVINAVRYYDSDNVLVTLTSNNYFYDQTGNRVVVSGGFPSNVSTLRANPVIVEYTVSPSILAQYPVIKQAGLLLLTHLYNNRSAVGDTVGMKAQIPFGVEVLLRPYKDLVM
jgi:uncharacterized phiE125 gp8 family phage protein